MEMLFGNFIGDAIGTDKNPIPDLAPPGDKEHPLEGEIEGIRLIGYADHYCPDTLVLHENKTSHNKSRWTKGKVDKHKQLTMYALLIHQRDGVNPEDLTMYLNFIQSRLVGVSYQLHEPPVWRQFETRRTMADLEEYKDYLVKTVEMMERYIEIRKLSPVRRSAPAFKAV